MEDTMEREDRRGGARKGAGRPKGDCQMVTFRAPGPVARRLAVGDDFSVWGTVTYIIHKARE